MKYAILVPLALSAVACSSNDASSDDDTTEQVTYYQDIAPLYFDKCVQCHNEDGIAPFSLDNYEEAKTFANAAKAATAAREMPPYLVRADGECGDFAESWALSDEEIELIAAWADGGALEGEPRTDLKARELPRLEGETISLKTPNFTPEIAGGALAEFDEYRCFLVDPKVDEDTFLTGYEVVPGNDKIVHHVLGFPVDLALEVDDGITNGDVIEALDDESPDREGWPCFGMAGDGVEVAGVPVTWAPGMGAVHYPHRAGVEFPAGSQMVIQVHYNLADPSLLGEEDSTTVKLEVGNQIERIGFFDLPDQLLDSLFEEEPVQIPAGEENFEFSFDFGYDEIMLQTGGQLQISGVLPHMHERGRTMKVEVLRDDSEMCMADVAAWDFNWQLFYFYEQPIELSPGDRLRVTCGFNTEGLDEPVLPGWGTQNEMCLAGLMLTLPVSVFQ